MNNAPPESATAALRPPVVVCAVDEAYAMCAATMLRSLAARLRRYPADVYILQDRLSPANRSKLSRSIPPDRLTVRWVDVDARLVTGLKVDGHVSVATYYRLQMEDVLPGVEKVIYLDCDTIVNQDIGLLWEMSVDQCHLLATPQVSPGARTAGGPLGLKTFEKLGLPPEAPLFNAGVLVANLRLWRRDTISNAVLDYLRSYPAEVRWWDQDGLNAVLAGRWQPLSYRWNVMTSLFRYYDTWKDSPLSRHEYYETITHPYIVHYNSSLKPWHVEYNLPYKELFHQYFSETSWSTTRRDGMAEEGAQ